MSELKQILKELNVLSKNDLLKEKSPKCYALVTECKRDIEEYLDIERRFERLRRDLVPLIEKTVRAVNEVKNG